MDLDIGRRIAVVGPSGSGKSALAAALAAHLGVPVIDLDALFHEPGWRPPPVEVFRTRVQSALLAPEAASGYVSAGNYSAVQDLVWERAETVIWLDLPLRVTLPRLMLRSWRRYNDRRLLWGTNRERFWGHLKLWSPPDSLIAWNISSHRRRRRHFEGAMRDPRWRQARFIRIRSTRGVEALRRDLGLPTGTRV